ncbi:GNAT family N-acetyltransferase [Brenneria populi]|uniref:GNAT family N-acetyltransferase n=1 Tax=Brenneria populi TaxID=1505588 RepID=A0ABU6JKL0_9GAMM|nr:GNAT family N-acetyltransferase [Brenneria populi Li et al. 2015]
MKNTLKIRRYHLDDIDRIISVFIRSINNIAIKDYTSNQIKAWGSIDKEVWINRLENSQVWVSTHNDQIIGFISLENFSYIDLLFVHPDYLRLGVATRLLKGPEGEAVRNGVGAITTDASITAKLFFAKHGFAVVRKQEVSLRGQSFINFNMEKKLEYHG